MAQPARGIAGLKPESKLVTTLLWGLSDAKDLVRYLGILLLVRFTSGLTVY